MIPAVARLNDVLDGLVAEGVVPGGVALIAGRDGVLFERAFGLRATDPAPEPSTADTLHDLASVTKPLATARLLLRARAAGRVSFDEPISVRVPEMTPLPGEPRAPTVGELLLHAGGLPAWEPLYARAAGGLPERARWIARHRDEPGRRAVYGCPGYQVLGLLLERLHGASLADIVREHVLGRRHDIVFGAVPPALRGRVAPTERGNAFERELAGARAPDPAVFRRDMIRGDIHDLNAFTIGGAGNAGLFGTARAVADLARPFLAPSDEFDDATLAELSMDLAPHAEDGGEQRTWGFQLARSLNSPAGDLASDRAFGHAGFTGTSVLIDPGPGLIHVLLTNRVHPVVTERAFHADRRRFHDAARVAADALRG